VGPLVVSLYGINPVAPVVVSLCGINPVGAGVVDLGLHLQNFFLAKHLPMGL